MVLIKHNKISLFFLLKLTFGDVLEAYFQTLLKYIWHQNTNSDDSNKVLDELGYDSDRNEPPMPTNDDTFHIEPRAGFKTRANTHKLPLINMVTNSLGSSGFHNKAK